MAKSSVTSVGKKWFLVLMIFLWGCIVLCGYIVFSIVNINKFNELSNQIDNIRIESQKSTVAAKEFLMNAYTDESFVKNGTNESFETFNRNMDTVLYLTKRFKESEYIQMNKRQLSVATLDSNLNSYKQSFSEIASLFKKKGFKDLGLEGDMRSAIHFIEHHKAPIDLEFLLTLRRHEKDFLLRKDYAYVEKFTVDLEKFEQHILNNKEISTESERVGILEELKIYKSTFLEIVDIETQIGLSPNEGLRYKFTSTLASAEKILSEINTEIKEQKRRASYAINIIIGSIIVVFILIISGVFFSVNYLNNAIIKPIHKLNRAAEEISEGNLSVNLEGIRNYKLMQDLVSSYEKLIEKLKATISHIELISSRKISSSFALKSDKDEIGKSLNKIIEELQIIDSEENLRAWAADGISKFGVIIRESSELKELSDKAISFLVKYLSANQGGLFIVKTIENRKVLNLEAAYAYNRKKYLHKVIEIGEGLVGQCYLENEIQYLTEIPNEYLTITSGMGDSNPRSIVIAPMVYNEEVEAVLELASFKTFEKYQIDFISKIGEMLASSIANVKTRELTESLLLESKMQSEQMKAQEEEMRQNLEEMMATHEEVARKESDYRKTIEELISEKEKINVELDKVRIENKQILSALKMKEIELQRAAEEKQYSEVKKITLDRYPRRIEHFLES